MASFDINNHFTGSQVYGRDRMGIVTPDAEFTETFRPFLPVPYPAPYLPTLREEQGHPVLASIVLTAQNSVGVDKSGALVPAGYICGSQNTKANGGQYFALKYMPQDVGVAFNPITCVQVAAVNEVAVLAAPSDGAAGDTITFPDGFVYTVTANDVTNAKACTLFPQGVVRPIALTIRIVYQYIGGVYVTNNTGGMSYTLDGVLPLKYKMLNYMHEAGTAVQTEMVMRLPWIGATETTLQTLANTDGVVGYTQTNYGRSYAHFVGATGFGLQYLAPGARVVAGRGFSAGHWTVYNPAVNDPTEVVGVVLGIQNQYPIKDYVNRVRTQYDPSKLGGPIADPHPASIMMGGSATAGMDFVINLGTDAIFKKAVDQNKPLHPEYYTFVEVAFRSF